MRWSEGKGRGRCERRDVDKGGERDVKGRWSGERWGVGEESGKDIWGENRKKNT